MPYNPTVLRPTYAPLRTTLATGQDSPRAIGVNGTAVFLAPAVAGASVVKYTTDTGSFVLSSTSAAVGAGQIPNAICMLNAQAIPALLVATDGANPTVKKLQQSDLTVVLGTITLT